MPITEAFTVTAAMAVLLNGLFLRRTYRRWNALRGSGENGPLEVISRTFIRVWLVILMIDLMVLGAGIGFLSHHPLLGYLLAAMPVASTLVGFFALRGFD